MEYARQNERIVLTHDLDFGTLLAVTNGNGPSVLQVRTNDVLPEGAGAVVLRALTDFVAELSAGALIVVDETRARVRILPLKAP